MGALALNMDLDSAMHILNYHLFSTSFSSVQSIFKYHIQYLEKKMSQIQKTVAVISPLPVSNSFTCLEVVHVEDKCTLDFPTPHVHNTIRKSRERPKKGLASDSKKAVLNSLLILFDYSESPESVNTEKPVLKLRRSVTIKREVKVPIEI